MIAGNRNTQPRHNLERLLIQENASLRLGVVADTHSAPHPRALAVLASLKPDAILHAGDIGDLGFLDELAALGKVFAVRGNIDARLHSLPDQLLLEVSTSEQLVVRLLMLHVGAYGPRLRADAARLARETKASLVVCGHSHVPFIGQDRGLTLFNPGSAGPRRFPLPVVFGMLEVNTKGIRMRHIDCETGQPWEPPA